MLLLQMVYILEVWFFRVCHNTEAGGSPETLVTSLHPNFHEIPLAYKKYPKKAGLSPSKFGVHGSNRISIILLWMAQWANSKITHVSCKGRISPCLIILKIDLKACKIWYTSVILEIHHKLCLGCARMSLGCSEFPNKDRGSCGWAGL